MAARWLRPAPDLCPKSSGPQYRVGQGLPAVLPRRRCQQPAGSLTLQVPDAGDRCRNAAQLQSMAPSARPGCQLAIRVACEIKCFLRALRTCLPVWTCEGLYTERQHFKVAGGLIICVGCARSWSGALF